MAAGFKVRSGAILLLLDSALHSAAPSPMCGSRMLCKAVALLFIHNKRDLCGRHAIIASATAGCGVKQSNGHVSIS